MKKYSHLSLSLLIVAISASGALYNMKKEGSKSIYVQGYIRTPDGHCVVSESCSSSGNLICTVGSHPAGARLWGKSSTGQCVIPLYLPQP